jgi:hypothetical protein
MIFTTTNNHAEDMLGNQVYVSVAIKGTKGNKIPVDGWFTMVDLSGNYDVIVGRNWMSANPHTIEY